MKVIPKYTPLLRISKTKLSLPMKFRGKSNKLGKTVAETHLSLQHIEETKGSTKRDRRLSEEASALDD